MFQVLKCWLQMTEGDEKWVAEFFYGCWVSRFQSFCFWPCVRIIEPGVTYG
jgi:hypothetical protein